ncbi:MAG TPA: cupin domain-containing protein [Terriglobales bacterium]|nr:cupin domain-containing protein [Terriglobales bacterium]
MRKWIVRILALSGVLLGTSLINPESMAQTQRQVSVREAFSHAISALDGNKLTVQLVEVTYGPGEASLPHTHPCPVIGYVVEGAIRTQVKGEAEATYKAGESFYEAANGVHQVSANASRTAPAKLLAFFVCDHEAPLSSQVAGGQH